jgi:uncharacterized lipoprotein YmbA
MMRRRIASRRSRRSRARGGLRLLAAVALLHARRDGDRDGLAGAVGAGDRGRAGDGPSIVDRPEFVVSTGPNEVRLDDFNRWAAPVQDGLSRAIAENLVAILGTPRVVRFPQTLAAEPDYRVAVEVRTFESTPGNSATLDAVWTVRRMKDGKTQTGRTSARETVAESGYDALAAAHSRAAARLSQDIARATVALQGEP